MANTEGLSDETLASLLSMPSPEEERQFHSRRPQNATAGTTGPRFPRRAIARREQMMELGEGETPSATVIRSSKPPAVRVVSARKKGSGGVASGVNNERHVSFEPAAEQTSAVAETVTPGVEEPEESYPESHPDADTKESKNSHRPVIISECIRERPVSFNTDINKNPSASANGGKRESRFKQRNRNKNGQSSIPPTAGGFPSLDIAPIGAFTRKGMSARNENPQSTVTAGAKSAGTTIPPNNFSQVATKSQKNVTSLAGKDERNGMDDVGTAADSMLANMSLEEIQDGVDEIRSILSADSIAFLRKRGKQKLSKTQHTGGGKKITVNNTNLQIPTQNEDGTTLTREEEIRLEEQREREAKEQTAKILSSVRTPEDMDRAYNEALKLGLAAELPSSALEKGEAILSQEGNLASDPDSRHNNLHVATSLLRSTAPRQRLLGAKTISIILEEDASALIESRRTQSFSLDNDDRSRLQNSYPPLLPVALRCLLDEAISTSQTSAGRLLLGLVLRCIHSLMILFVHPYHVVQVGESSIGSDDPSIIYQTSFMNDVFHVPPSSDLYPPTKIEPMGDGGAKDASCYRTDSSAASAESDSKAFYTDPAWTLISRMRMIPCISNVVTCLSKDDCNGIIIPATSINNVCGILSMLAVRSPGAAGAIASHKGILPFLMSHCLSPSNHDFVNVSTSVTKESKVADGHNGESSNKGTSSFSKNAIPALQLLCTLARQSRDVAQLEPFEKVIPDLQAILCMGSTMDELDSQKWSLILLRILLKYGFAVEHIQTIISMSVPHISAATGSNDNLSSEYFVLFAGVCDCARSFAMQQKDENDQEVSPDQRFLDSLAMSGVWLTSAVKESANSLQSIGNEPLHVTDSPKTRFLKMKLAAAQLKLLAAYTAAASPATFFGDGALQEKMKKSFIPVVSKESRIKVFDSVVNSGLWIDALRIALAHSFSAGWDTTLLSGSDKSLEEESIACAFITSFMNFAVMFEAQELENSRHNELIGALKNALEITRSDQESHSSYCECIHASRQSWFINSEFAVFKFLCKANNAQLIDKDLLMAYAFSLVGRLTIGQEVMALFIFNQDYFFSLRDEEHSNSIASSGGVPMALLGELCSTDSRKVQLEHSMRLQSIGNSSRAGPFNLRSLRCAADVMVGTNSGANDERSLLPIGGIWLWNLISSTVEMPNDTAHMPDIPEQGDPVANTSCIVSHAMGILLQLEASSFPGLVKTGTKLYHIANAFLYPEEVLRFTEESIAALFNLLYSNTKTSEFSNSSLVYDFIKACYDHSRLSKEKKSTPTESSKEKTIESDLQEALSQTNSQTGLFSHDELRALNDFINDICESYIEHGGQYDTFSLFLRFFLRHDFPPKVISDVLTKLHPILNLLTVDEPRESTFKWLVRSVSGGLPSLDSSHRDPSSVLDSYATALKKRDRELFRSDYVYLLSIATLSRNLASSSQRCECGLEAMKKRLSGVSDEIFYDVVQVGSQFLSDGAGTKESLITSLLETCLNRSTSFSKQDHDVQKRFAWNRSNEESAWNEAVKILRSNSGLA